MYLKIYYPLPIKCCLASVSRQPCLPHPAHIPRLAAGPSQNLAAHSRSGLSIITQLPRRRCLYLSCNYFDVLHAHYKDSNLFCIWIRICYKCNWRHSRRFSNNYMLNFAPSFDLAFFLLGQLGEWVVSGSSSITIHTRLPCDRARPEPDSLLYSLFN